MNDQTRKVDEILAKKFQELLPDADAPDSLKEEVFRTLDFLNMFGDIAELYTSKFGAAEIGFLELLNKDGENKESTEDENS